MIKMDAEERQFHEHRAQSMKLLMQTFLLGNSALELAEKDDQIVPV